MRRMTVLIAAALIPAAVGVSQTVGEPDPLFQSNDAIELRIAGPIKTLRRKRSDEEDLPARASWQESDGRTMDVDIALRARGNFRRRKDICPFPPIRLSFDTDTVKGTTFEKQRNLKLVTHCRDNSKQALQNVFKEYLTYRMFNLLSDVSYKVRLLSVTYEDTDSKGKRSNTYAFVIEHRRRLAKRTGLPSVHVFQTQLEHLDPEFTNLVSIFQYMIGNTDYSPIAGPKGEKCCHNAKLFGGATTPIFSVPYDFDMSGMVNTSYASPNPRFKIDSVRQRVYRGRCPNNHLVPATIAKFVDNKDAFFELVAAEPRLTNSTRKSMQSFLSSFYKIIEDPKSVEKRIIQRCVKPS